MRHPRHENMQTALRKWAFEQPNPLERIQIELFPASDADNDEPARLDPAPLLAA